MEKNEATDSHSSLPDAATSSSLFSELIAAYLEYVRVEHGRPPITVERYRARLQRFIDELGDCRVGEITPAKLSLYKRHLMDAELGPVTIGGFLSCLRGFVRYVRDVQGFPVMDAEKIKRPRIPQRTVDYLTKEELDRLLGTIPTHTWKGLRDRALIEVLFSSGMAHSRTPLAEDHGARRPPADDRYCRTIPPPALGRRQVCCPCNGLYSVPILTIGTEFAMNRPVTSSLTFHKAILPESQPQPLGVPSAIPTHLHRS